MTATYCRPCDVHHDEHGIPLSTILATEVREGDILHMSLGITGTVTELPEWEDVDDDDFQVGTIKCETFGAFVFSTDEMRVFRN